MHSAAAVLGCRCRAAGLAVAALLFAELLRPGCTLSSSCCNAASLPLPCRPLSRLLPAFPPPPLQQILLFSATFNERVKRFAQKIVPDANQVRG